jgi:hypothetical protein
MSEKAPIERARERLLEQLPALVDEYIDTARAEGTTQAFDRLMGFALKAVDGLQVDPKAGQYANLPVIHVSFGPGMQLTVEPGQAPPAPLPLVEEVTDATPPAVLPDDPLDLLPAPEPTPTELAEREVLEALAAAGSAMVMEPD